MARFGHHMLWKKALREPSLSQPASPCDTRRVNEGLKNLGRDEVENLDAIEGEILAAPARGAV